MNSDYNISAGMPKKGFLLVLVFSLGFDGVVWMVPIRAIGLECGFDSQRMFNRVFKEEYKMTPREYRNRLRIERKSS